MAISGISKLVFVLLWLNVVQMAKAMSHSLMIIKGEESPGNLRCTGHSCASGCSCTSLGRGGLQVNCSHRYLTEIPPKLPVNTEHLLLDNNHIQTVEGEAFRGCSWLKLLDLSDNMLSEIARAAFSGLPQLEELYLERNTRKELQFPMDAFKETRALKTLNLQQVHVLSRAYNCQQLIGNLTNLQTLMISISQMNWRVVFDTISIKLAQLEELHIHCMNIQLRNYTFYSFRNSSISKLLMRCIAEGQEVSRYSFFPRLETLDLGYTRYSNPNKVSRFWPGLNETNIRALLLENMFIKPTKLEESFYRGLQQTNLTRLILDNNFIVSIGKYLWIVTYLPNLGHLSLKDNMIFMPNDAFRYMRCHTNLKSLVLNQAVWLNPVVFDAVENISKRAGSHARLSSDVRRLEEDCGVIENHFSDGEMHVKLPDSLEYLHMASQGYTAGVPTQLSIIASQRLKYFRSDYSNLKTIKSVLRVRDKMPHFKITLDLIYRQLTSISAEFGEAAGNITGNLSLANNELGNQLAGDKTGKIFGKFTELTALDLSTNMIKTLHKYVFRAQEKLQELHLAQNNLQLLHFSFQHMNLTHLDLTGNLFSQLSEGNCNDLDCLSHKLNHTVFLSLAENPLQCSCETLDFLQWCLHTKVKFKDWLSMTCVYHGSVINLSILKSNIIPELNVRCRGQTWLIASSVTLTLALLLIAISVVLYRHRFEVRFALLNLVIQRKKYDALNEKEDYVYDAFVAFDMADVDWVSDVLLPKLEQEGERRFHLCVHHRDFTGGTPIVENIADAICSSRKVIVILTKNFLASSWCQFELETTQIRSFEEGKDLIIPVLKEDLPVANMSKTLRVLLRRNTYITWPEQEQEISNFWKALRRALDSKSSRIIRCQCGNNINL